MEMRLKGLLPVTAAGLTMLASLSTTSGQGRLIYAGDDDWDWASPLGAEEPSKLAAYGKMPWSALDWIEDGLPEVQGVLIGNAPLVGDYLDVEGLTTLRGDKATYRHEVQEDGVVRRVLGAKPPPDVLILMDDTGKAGRLGEADMTGLADFLDGGGRLLVLGDARSYEGVLEAVLRTAEALPRERLPAPVKPDAAFLDRVAGLVRRLDADDFQTREAATAELKKLGLPALELAQGVKGAGPEAKARLARLRSELAPPPPERDPERPMDAQARATTARVRAAAKRLQALGIECQLPVTLVNAKGDPLECLRVLYPER